MNEQITLYSIPNSERTDLISRQEAIDALNRLCPYPGEWSVNGLGLCKDAIAICPSIDAVPVIRCKDCKYNLNNDRLFADPDPILTYAWCNTEAFQENDFCSKGKRREE